MLTFKYAKILHFKKLDSLLMVLLSQVCPFINPDELHNEDWDTLGEVQEVQLA